MGPETKGAGSRERRRKRRQFAAELVQDFADNCSLHGLKYISERDRSLVEKDLFSKIELYYKEPRYVSMRRSELFGLTDFLANCGGLLGLFLGFSFLSLVEIFYFLTIRLGCTLRRDT